MINYCCELFIVVASLRDLVNYVTMMTKLETLSNLHPDISPLLWFLKLMIFHGNGILEEEEENIFEVIF